MRVQMDVHILKLSFCFFYDIANKHLHTPHHRCTVTNKNKSIIPHPCNTMRIYKNASMNKPKKVWDQLK